MTVSISRMQYSLYIISRWWFQIFVYFHPYLGKIPILTHIFQGGWFNHRLDLFMIPPFGRYQPTNIFGFPNLNPPTQNGEAKNNDCNPKVVGIMATVLAFGALHLGETQTVGSHQHSEIQPLKKEALYV